MNKILMVGQFSPIITGESTCNNIVYKACSAYYEVTRINSNLINNVGEVGSLTLSKLFVAAMIILKSCFYVFKTDVIYVTPGQSLFGLLRFTPIVLLSIFFKKKIICHWHGYGILRFLERRNMLSKIFFSKKVINIVLTNDLKIKIEHLINNCRIKVVRNFYIPYDYKPKLCINMDRFNILFLGGLMEQKGILEFLESSKNNNMFSYHVCGTGSESIVNKIKLLDNDNYIKYYGLVSGESKHTVFENSDVFVLQTYYPTEGVPLAILEAMSYGCAIVTTKHNGIPETVGDAAYFIDPKSEVSLSSALKDLYQNRDLLVDLKKRSLVRSKEFRMDKFESSILGVIEE